MRMAQRMTSSLSESEDKIKGSSWSSTDTIEMQQDIDDDDLEAYIRKTGNHKEIMKRIQSVKLGKVISDS